MEDTRTTPTADSITGSRRNAQKGTRNRIETVWKGDNTMTIEQTKGFIMDVNHMVHLIDDCKYNVGAAEFFADHLRKLAKYRGRDYAIRAAKKANKQAKRKAFLWESI